MTARLLDAFAATRSAPRPSRSTRSPAARSRFWATAARGLTNTEIAAELHISLSTVKTHIASLMAKLGARNRVEIAIWAYESGLGGPLIRPGSATRPGWPKV